MIPRTMSQPPFRPARPSQAPARRRGSGVGLSIVRELVRAMGGAVVLLPTEAGAHFHVELPDDL